MIQRLGAVVGDLGKNSTADATALNARRSGDAAQVVAKGDGQIHYDRQGLPMADGGRKEYTDEAGVVTRIVEWFGYKLHLLVDARHEVALAYRISSTKVGDNEMVGPLVEQAQGNLPPGRLQTLAYDKAADDEKVHALLDQASIQPVIQNRSLWKEDKERMLPGHDGTSNIVYDEAGTVYCYDRVSQVPVRHKMAYIGREPDRRSLKYRCPARHHGLACPSDQKCNGEKLYGLTVRVNRDIDLRRFPPIPRATKKFERLYKGRTASERVNARLKVFWGADDGNISGARRFHAHVGAVMVVHAAFATVLASLPRREGTLGKMRLSPIAQALRQSIAA